ncbi:MAG: hypothetical protein HY746_00930 [Elusimicrobia bacterium]|nr:hypothetical protein [Elusimicrobiota bacterium]
MKKFFLFFAASAMFGVVSSFSQEEAKVDDIDRIKKEEIIETEAKPAQENLDYVPKYGAEISEAIKYLSFLKDKSDKIDSKTMEDIIKQVADLTLKLKTALGPEMLKEIEEKEKKQAEAIKEIRVKQTLASIRSALMIYYGDFEGNYPKNFEELVPAYLKEIPEIEVPGHAKTNKITVIDQADFDTELESAIKDTGGWIYFSNTSSINWGTVLIDCSHKDTKGTEWYKY